MLFAPLQWLQALTPEEEPAPVKKYLKRWEWLSQTAFSQTLSNTDDRIAHTVELLFADAVFVNHLLCSQLTAFCLSDKLVSVLAATTRCSLQMNR